MPKEPVTITFKLQQQASEEGKAHVSCKWVGEMQRALEHAAVGIPVEVVNKAQIANQHLRAQGGVQHHERWLLSRWSDEAAVGLGDQGSGVDAETASCRWRHSPQSEQSAS
jgi:hypothetical protein